MRLLSVLSPFRYESRVFTYFHVHAIFKSKNIAFHGTIDDVKRLVGANSQYKLQVCAHNLAVRLNYYNFEVEREEWRHGYERKDSVVYCLQWV